MEVNSDSSPGRVAHPGDSLTAFDSPTFDRDVQIRVGETVGSASISPSGRDVVLASREGLHIIDLDFPYSPPRHLAHYSPWEVADVQWSPFASRDYWIVSTSNQKALVWNLELPAAHAPIQYTLHAHSRAITDINFSAHHPDILATCAVDSYVHCWDLRRAARPAMTFADWNAGATQVKWSRQDEHIIASSHDKFLRIWDDRKGAYPLKSIEAHTTKIYGIDWNRTRPTAVLTCSLDKTIKFWDYASEADEPERVIQTVFPVWRARHTPFGWGVLAMPQRSNYDLHLYDRRLDGTAPRCGLVKPVHSFEGHKDQVKEFLWRPRGNVENGVDNREFQLISWGMDRELHLHRMDPAYLRAVGYEKGKEVQHRLNLTRKGAIYKTFHDETPKTPEDTGTNGQVKLRRPLGLGALVSAAGMSKAPAPHAPLKESGLPSSSISMYGRRQMRRKMNPIKWMEGVKMGHRSESMLDPFLADTASHPLGHTHHPSWDARESLSDEMTNVARKYKRVNFERADVHRRTATVTLHGPWTGEGKPAFLRVNIDFPDGYPISAAATCSFERTTAAISEEMLAKLSAEVKSIMLHYLSRKTGCLEAIITYLLGERDLEQSIATPVNDILDEPADESSSDEDPVGEEADLETSATDTAGLRLVQANVPLPKACGAYWSNDGRLICFFPPKPEPKPIFNLHALRTGERSGKGHRQFEGFGRLVESSPSSKERMSAVAEEGDESDETSSSGSYPSSTSSSSSGSSDDISRLPARFKPPSAWRAATLKFHKASSHSSGGQTREMALAKPKSVISIHDFSDLLPAKKCLAEQYQIFGPGAEVCKCNAEVAAIHGMDDLAAVWTLCESILYDKVPLEILEQSVRKEPILVLARRNMVRVKRRDSATELQFDEPQSVSNPSLTGRVKWGRHPLASSWLIPLLFAHYESLADIQMLAMLSCVFWEPAARGGVPNALMKSGQHDLPIAMKTPAFSLDYFPSKTVAWSLFRNKKGKDRSRTGHNDLRELGQEPAFWNSSGSRLGVYGSAESSNGPWSADVNGNEPPTPYSTGNTPPGRGKLSTRIPSFSAGLPPSPDFSQRSLKRSASNMSTAYASFNQSVPHTASTSPNDKYLPEPELSTSAPSTGVTWGSTTVYSTSTTPSPEKRRRVFNRRRSSTFDSGYDSSDDDQPAVSSTEDTVPVSPEVYRTSDIPTIRVKLRNQHLFNDDGYASTPLLDPKEADSYRAYRESYAELLSMWGLAIPRAEMLKFNGLTSYWVAKAETPATEDAYPRSDTQAKNVEPRQSLLTIAAAQQQIRTLNPPASANASPRLAAVKPSLNPTSPTKVRRTSSQRLNPAAKEFIPKTSTPPPGSIRLDASSTLIRADNHGTQDGRPSQTSQKSSCVVCWQPILGLSCYCSSGTHLLHAECNTSLRSDSPDPIDEEHMSLCFCMGIPTP